MRLGWFRGPRVQTPSFTHRPDERWARCPRKGGTSGMRSDQEVSMATLWSPKPRDALNISGELTQKLLTEGRGERRKSAGTKQRTIHDDRAHASEASAPASRRGCPNSRGITARLRGPLCLNYMKSSSSCWTWFPGKRGCDTASHPREGSLEQRPGSGARQSCGGRRGHCGSPVAGTGAETRHDGGGRSSGDRTWDVDSRERAGYRQVSHPGPHRLSPWDRGLRLGGGGFWSRWPSTNSSMLKKSKAPIKRGWELNWWI